MAKKILIKIGNNKVTAKLNNSQTAILFSRHLPMQLSLNRWGDEYYGNCGLNVKSEKGARAEMEVRACDLARRKRRVVGNINQIDAA